MVDQPRDKRPIQTEPGHRLDLHREPHLRHAPHRHRGRHAIRCPMCGITIDLCFCDQLEQVENKVEVVVLRHRGERWKTTNTGILIHRVLLNSKLITLELDNNHPELHTHAFDPACTAVLFPGECATPLEALPAQSYPKTLIVVDGTWSQANRMNRRMPALTGLPRISIQATAPSLYGLRKAPRPGGLCTIEAVTAALVLLEEPHIAAALQRALETLVTHIKWSRQTPPGTKRSVRS